MSLMTCDEKSASGSSPVMSTCWIIRAGKSGDEEIQVALGRDLAARDRSLEDLSDDTRARFDHSFAKHVT